MEPTIRELLKEGFRVIAPDQIGFGKSPKPPTYQFTFQTLAENTRDLLDHLNVDRVQVVGHSMGGMLATRFALMFPDRTEQLALVNPIGLEDWKTLVPYQVKSTSALLNGCPSDHTTPGRRWKVSIVAEAENW